MPISTMDLNFAILNLCQKYTFNQFLKHLIIRNSPYKFAIYIGFDCIPLFPKLFIIRRKLCIGLPQLNPHYCSSNELISGIFSKF